MRPIVNSEIFANSVKNICDIKNSRKGHDLPIPANDRVISPFREGFILTKLHVCENEPLEKISKFTVLFIMYSCNDEICMWYANKRMGAC